MGRLPIFAVLTVIAIVATAYTAIWLVRTPAANCFDKPVSDIWADDKGYKATLIIKDCGMGETVSYSVRVDAFSPPLRHAWFMTEEIRTDERPEVPPSVRWEGARVLAIEMNTRTLRGSLIRNVGEDLTLEVKYTPRLPYAFPNF